MKSLAILVIFSFMAIVSTDQTDTTSIYDFEVQDIDGNTVSMNDFKGKVVLVVNTASECGFTPQYEGLQALYEQYKDDGLVVLGFPANNFGGQEPGTEEEIKQFCKVNYDVTFPMFSKVSVKGGDIHPLFDFLTSQENANFTGEIKWNFEKFLIDKNGILMRRFRSKVEPESDEILNTIESSLNS